MVAFFIFFRMCNRFLAAPDCVPCGARFFGTSQIQLVARSAAMHVGVISDFDTLGDRLCKKAPSNGSTRPKAMGSSGHRPETKTFVHISAVERAGSSSL